MTSATPDKKPKKPRWHKCIWQTLLHAGDVSGKLITLIALPSAIAAVIAYYDEIGDVLTPPDVVAAIDSVGMRCALALNVDPNTPNLLDVANKQCGESPISAWVQLELENEDKIDRTLVAIAAHIKFPNEFGFPNSEIELTQARVVEDALQNDFKVDQRVPWRALQLGPGQKVPIEVDFRPFAQEDQIPFDRYRNLIKAEPSPLPLADITLDVVARFSGVDGWLRLGRCQLNIKAASVASKARAEFIRALTSACKQSD